MHDDKFDKGYNYDAMRHHHGPEDPYDYPSHGHRHPAYDFPDVYHPVPYGKEYLGNQPIHLQNPHNGHIVHPCPPRDWGRHGCPPEEHHHHCYEPMHVPPMKDYLSEYVGLLEDYFHKDKGLDDCDCGEAIRHLRDEINALLKAMGRDLNELGNEYDSIKSKLAYYIGKTQACIQSTEEYMRRQEYIGTDWEEMKATFQAVIDEWEAIDAISVIDYFLEGETIVDMPTVDELIEAYISDMPAITTLNWVNRVENSDELTETQLSEYSRVVYHYNEPTVGTSIEFTTFLKDDDTYTDNVHGNYLVLVDRIEVVEECEDKKVLEHAEKWARTEGYPQLHTLKDYSQGTTDKAVKTRMIDDGAVTSAKIGSKAVTTGKIDDGAVETDKIADKNVTEGKLSDDVVRKLNKDDDTKYTLTKDGNTITLTGSDGSVTSVTDKDEDHNTTYTLSKDGNTITLTGSDGSTTSVTDSDNDTVFVLEDGSVTTAKLGNSAVTNAKINNGAVSEEKLSSAVREKLNQDDDTTYTLSGNGKQVILTDSDGNTTRAENPYMYIFLGDDYDTVTNGWVNKVATRMNLGNTEYRNACATGAGFIGETTTYLEQLQSATSGMTTAEKQMVKAIVIVGGYNDRDKVIDTNAYNLSVYIRNNFINAKVYLGMAAWKCNALAGGHKYDTGYLDMVKKYCTVAGNEGWAFMDNLQYVLHDYALLDSTGLKPNTNGCYELARAIVTCINGGSYNMHRVGRLVTITPDPAINLQPTSQNNLFPDDQNNYTTSFMQLIDNGTVYCRLDNFWCVEFKNATNLIGHGPDGTGGRIGTFTLFTFDVAEGFFEGAEFYGGKPFPCAVVDSNGNVTNALIYISFIDNKVRANLYKVKEKQTAQSVGIEFEEFDNVKFIHWGTPPPSWVYDAYMC